MLRHVSPVRSLYERDFRLMPGKRNRGKWRGRAFFSEKRRRFFFRKIDRNSVAVAKSGAKWGEVGQKTTRHPFLINTPFFLLTFSRRHDSCAKSASHFSGEFCHALDPKNLVTIPSRWRASEADEFFLMPDRSGQFSKVMPPEQFRAVAEKLKTDPKITPKERTVFLRLFYSGAQQAVSDKQGRVIIPEEMSKAVGLSTEVVLVGALDTFELWNPVAWAATKQTEEATFERLADLIGL
jgi:MraZ protein